MKLKLAAIALALVAVAVVYLFFIRDKKPGDHDQNTDACGTADLGKGADAVACRAHAWDLIGRRPQRDLDAGRALLAKLCQQAYQQACADLEKEQFACASLEIEEGRCNGDWFKPADASACVAVAEGITGEACTKWPKFRNPSYAKEWYAKGCSLGASAACGK